MESKNLRKLLNEYEEIDINEMLKNFRSIKNSGTKNDIEIFLHEKAIKFEKSSISSTYVVFSEDNEILGYFTIANRSLVIPKENFGILSKTQQKKLGNSAAILKNGDLMTSSFLLGQLGKNYSDDIENLITGRELLTFAYDLFLKIKELINVKYIWLECQNEPKLISFYQNFGFKMLESLTSEEGLKVMIMELK
ncbi:hypothetical protein [Leptotrichia buccalis]|uniref:Phage protein n=1 Tax=Leptotrichia buccalis (strain ATCC 14201 / DSM 1135 / JCM 12969 / NCTC 10249 / C-1013-b) TaxID=523794 RepID=C7N9M8_LEPBD|nr:hypothetical protein [Leptotrichia buccalis]ACV38859.1 unknown phage protein [Leptotrichia buccalis C-1013-b]